MNKYKIIGLDQEFPYFCADNITDASKIAISMINMYKQHFNIKHKSVTLVDIDGGKEHKLDLSNKDTFIQTGSGGGDEDLVGEVLLDEEAHLDKHKELEELRKKKHKKEMELKKEHKKKEELFIEEELTDKIKKRLEEPVEEEEEEEEEEVKEMPQENEEESNEEERADKLKKQLSSELTEELTEKIGAKLNKKVKEKIDKELKKIEKMIKKIKKTETTSSPKKKVKKLKIPESNCVTVTDLTSMENKIKRDLRNIVDKEDEMRAKEVYYKNIELPSPKQDETKCTIM